MAFPTGEKLKIGSRLKEVDGGGEPGYDHCYVICQNSGEGEAFVARAEDEESGRRMEVYSTSQESNCTREFSVKRYERCTTFNTTRSVWNSALSDSINQNHFPSVVLNQGIPSAQEQYMCSVHLICFVSMEFMVSVWCSNRNDVDIGHSYVAFVFVSTTQAFLNR